MIEPIIFWVAGFCTGAAFTGGLAGWLRPRMGPPRGSNGNCVPMPPGTPAPGYRRVYLRSLSRVVSCDGPCEAGPEYCNCGLMWHDVPIKPQPPSRDPRQPEQPLAADLIRYSRWRSEQIERALRDEPPTPN